MSAPKHTPGPWRVERNCAGLVLRRTYSVVRTVGHTTEGMRNANGNTINFRSRESALAAIAVATGSAS